MLKIVKHHNVSDPGGKEGPHPHYGKFICTITEAAEHNLIALFIEQVWNQVGDETVSVSMNITDDETIFWVNANTPEKVIQVIDTVTDGMIKPRFKNEGFTVEVEEK
ncbi:hypothetical protein HOB10_04315 [Candidatus Parcubacteria bacterium]|jgi:hypothetical protein|nr:hypothetical protein [Candidatus Parcubacteria bacterium]